MSIVKEDVEIGVFNFTYMYDTVLEGPMSGILIDIPNCESVFDMTPFGVCSVEDPVSFSVLKRFAIKKDAFITTFVFLDQMKEEYDVGRPLDIQSIVFALNPYSQDYYVRADGERELIREFGYREDTTIMQMFDKLKPEVFSPPRVLTEFLSEMESLMLNMLDYELLESPYLYASESPYIHIGTKMNRVIYPSSTISIKGKRGRYGSY